MYEKELNSAEVKAKAKECGADIVGIAPMSRWEGVSRTILISLWDGTGVQVLI